MLRIGVIGYSSHVTKTHVMPFLRELEEVVSQKNNFNGPGEVSC